MGCSPGTLIGFFLGILPGGGAVLASFVSYAIEKGFLNIRKNLGPVSSKEWRLLNRPIMQRPNPPLSAPFFGNSSNVVMAVLFGGLLIHGIRPARF
jgi:putative tricarboxylic transport membrane protein